MTDIQRWEPTLTLARKFRKMDVFPDGEWVRYVDHVADKAEALRQAEEDWNEAVLIAHRQGQRDALAEHGPCFRTVVHECCEKAQVAEEALRQAEERWATFVGLDEERQMAYEQGQRDMLAALRTDGACVCQCGKASHAIRGEQE